MTFSAVILAGGQSRRMGRDKAWIEFQGQPLLALAVEKIRKTGAAEVFISGRAEVDYAALNCLVLRDHQPDLGPLSGIESGLAACRSPLLLVLAVDMARMPPEFLQELVAQCDPQTGAVPELATGLEPLAAVYPRPSHALAVAALAEARLSARGFAETCQQQQLVRYWPVSATNSHYFSNWNCPDDVPSHSN